MPLERLTAKNYQIEFHSHAEAILAADFPECLTELADVLDDLTIPIDKIVKGGGGEMETTQGLRRSLASYHWRKHNFVVEKLIDGTPREAISHEVDHVRELPKGKIALEVEWNNKDPFFDRNLENFKRLHADGAISVGIIITRGMSMQRNMRAMLTRFATERGITSYNALKTYTARPTDRQEALVESRMRSGHTFADAWVEVFCSDKFGQATTHWGKLEDRVSRGVGNPCPLLLIGIPDSVIRFERISE